MMQVILIFHVLFALALIGLVLVQQGKGATTGAAFGSGASSTVFGSQGANSFLLKMTAGLALLFFITSLSLTYLLSHPGKASQPVDVLDQAAQLSQSEANVVKTLPKTEISEPQPSKGHS